MAGSNIAPGATAPWARTGISQTISAEGRARLERGARLRRFGSGVTFIREGERGDVAYLIKAGRVRVHRIQSVGSAPMTLAILGPGQIVGEVAVLQGVARSASVTTMEEVEVLEFPGPLLRDVLRMEPVREDVRPAQGL